MKYKEIKKNHTLNSFIDKNKCDCGKLIGTNVTILFNGGNPKYCMTCNVLKGFMK